MINFRQFKDEEILFSMDENKKLTVLLGDNTTGKTTLVKAFLWCLYQENTFGTRILLNNDVLEELEYGDKKEAKIIVELVHDNTKYTITTRETYYRDKLGTVRVDTRATTTILEYNNEKGSIPTTISKLVKEKINDILSEELKNYFFFEGENNTIESASTKKNLKEAISKMLGIGKIEALKSYFKSDGVASRFKNKKTTIDLLKEELLKSNISDAKYGIDELNKENTKIEDEIKNLEDQQNECKNIIEENKETRELQIKLKDEQMKLNSDIANGSTRFSQIQRNVNSNNALLRVLFYYNFRNNKLAKELKSSTFNNNDSLSNIEEAAIDQLIDRGYCLCGAKIEDSNDAYKHLIDAKQHMAPHNYDKYVEDFSEYEERNMAPTLLSDILTSINDFIELIENINYKKEEIKNIKKQIKDKPNVAIYQTKVDQIDGQIKEKKSIKVANDIKIKKKQSELQRDESELSKIAADNQENDLYDLCIKYADTIYRLVEKHINDEYRKTKIDLNKLVNDIFKDMYHGNRTISIDENYNVDTKLSSGKELDQSTGLSTVVNYAFVIGLIKLIRDKKEEVTDEIESDDIDNIYPLVMDAPFSSLDETHISNICKALTRYCNQVIIAVMEKDFKTAISSVNGLIGKAYRFEKISESYTKIVEVEI